MLLRMLESFRDGHPVAPIINRVRARGTEKGEKSEEARFHQLNRQALAR